MRTIKSTVAALAAALFICFEGNSAAQAQTGGKSLCVVSAFGHWFEAQKIGVMVFGNAMDGASIDSWGIDGAAAGKVGQILGKKFAVRRITVSKAALQKLETRAGFLHNPYDDFLRTAVSGAGKCDFYLTMTRAVSPYNSTNQAVAGLGILSAGAPINERFYVFASYMVKLHDSNLAVLKSEKPSMYGLLGSAFTMTGLNCMYKQVDQSWWPASAKAAVQNAQLKNTIRALVEEGLAKSLPGMFKAQ